MIDEDRVELTVVGKISDIGEFDWDACASSSDAGSRPVDPFVTYRFLKGLEDSKSIGAGTGWIPQYIVAKYNKVIIGVMPSFAKGHSQGEYIFDHNWAHAYENSGGKYYPKLQVSIPFTPVTGRRFLTLPEFHDIAQSALLEGLQIIVRQQRWSSAHITFCSAEEFKAGEKLGLLQRIGQQFHSSEFWSFSLEQFQVFTVRRICNNHKFAVEILQRSRAPGAAAVNKLLGDFKILGGKNQ